MGFSALARRFAPLAALAAATALTACDGNISVDYDGDGVPLAELDLSGDAPTGIVLAGADNVEVSAGDSFTVDVEGDADIAELLRFVIEDGSLVVHRQNGSSGDGTATVRVTLPTLESMVVAGSGALTTDAVGSNAAMVMAGSGSISATSVSADALDVVITGSGTVSADGTAQDLSINIVGSGDVEMEGLTAETADANIVGSGDATFASDGRVEATFVGSGDVTVIGVATCESSAVGSGTLRCGSGE